MNILFICDEYPPGKNGGIGSAVQVLSGELSKQGHRIYVAGLYSQRYGEASHEHDGDIEVWRFRYGIRLPVNGESRLYNLYEKLPAWIRRNLNGRKAFDRFIEFIHALVIEKQIDIIEIADFNNFCTHIGFTVKWPAFKVPMVLKIHGSHTYFAHDMLTVLHEQFRQTDKALFQRADAIAAVSHYAADSTRKLLSITKPIEVLYNTVPVNPAPFDAREPYTVVFSGSLAYKKGIFSLLKAWNLVQQRVPQAHLLIYGKGRTEALQNLIQPHAQSSVVFGGHVSREELSRHLGKASLGVFPSYSETFGLAVAEAMGTGCPVIYTSRSSGPEIVQHGQTGWLIDPDNIEALADAIVMLLNDVQKREQLGKAGYESVRERFGAEKSAHAHLAFYMKTIHQFKAA